MTFKEPFEKTKIILFLCSPVKQKKTASSTPLLLLGGSSTRNCKPNAWACGGWRQHPARLTSDGPADVLCREQKTEQGEEQTHNSKDCARCKTAVKQTTGFTREALLHKEARLWSGFSGDWDSSCRQEKRNIFFPKIDIFAVSVYAFQINKQEPIWCKDLTWKADQLIAFSFSQEQQMLHCAVLVLVPNGYWLDQISSAKEKCFWIVGTLATLRSCSARPRLPAALSHDA